MASIESGKGKGKNYALVLLMLISLAYAEDPIVFPGMIPYMNEPPLPPYPLQQPTTPQDPIVEPPIAPPNQMQEASVIVYELWEPFNMSNESLNLTLLNNSTSPFTA